MVGDLFRNIFRDVIEGLVVGPGCDFELVYRRQTLTKFFVDSSLQKIDGADPSIACFEKPLTETVEVVA